MGKGRFLAPLGFVLFVLFVFVNVGQVWAAVSFSPNPPVAGQPFTITSNLGIGKLIAVFGACGCNVACHISNGNSPYTLTLPTAGQYNANDGSGCTSFTVNPAATSTTTTSASPIPEYPLGLPILAILTVLAYSVIRRKTRN